MGYQLAAATVCAAWAFAVSCVLLFVINRIPGCHIRASEEDEVMGLDAKYLYDVEIESLDLQGYDAVESPSRNFPAGSGASSVKVTGGSQVKGEAVGKSD